jgi:hypothetical protein
MERRRHRSGGPRPDITAEPLDLSGLYTLPADADAILGEKPTFTLVASPLRS